MHFNSVKGKSASENWVWICHGDLQRKSPTHLAHLSWEALNAEKAQILKLNKKKRVHRETGIYLLLWCELVKHKLQFVSRLYITSWILHIGLLHRFSKRFLSDLLQLFSSSLYRKHLALFITFLFWFRELRKIMYSYENFVFSLVFERTKNPCRRSLSSI